MPCIAMRSFPQPTITPFLLMQELLLLLQVC
jgi:hypothetical protein